jgi:hAT family C-terminal dimerisation region
MSLAQTTNANEISGPTNSVMMYLCQFMNGINSACTSVNDAFDFWKQRRVTSSHLSMLAEDLLLAPAAEAFVERVFSVYSLLTNGQRNRMDNSLEMRVILKLIK